MTGARREGYFVKSTMNHRRIILRVISETYRRNNLDLPRGVIRYRLEFPREILPPYRFYISDIGGGALLEMGAAARVKYTEILLHTKCIGEYTEHEVGGDSSMQRKTTYFREHDGGWACPAKLEPGLTLA
jgi:hypothetical protein